MYEPTDQLTPRELLNHVEHSYEEGEDEGEEDRRDNDLEIYEDSSSAYSLNN